MREIIYTPAAAKQLLRIERRMANRIVAKLEQYSRDPASLANQVKRLTGSVFLRLRVGEYRVIFDDRGTVLLVAKVGHRGDVYD